MRLQDRRSRRGARALAAGFTIVEVLMVIAVMTILFTLVVVAASRLQIKANVEATKALLLRLKDGLDEYKRLKGSYPPDGYDVEVKSKQGFPIVGAACLYEFLGHDLMVEETVAGQVRRSSHPKLLEFKPNELSAENPDQPGVFELRDGFGLPLHYDNTENDVFDPARQTETAHLEPVEGHPDDPRTDPAVVPRPGIQRRGAYDLWSHGTHKAHGGEEVDLKLTIGSWNVDVDRAARTATEDEDRKRRKR